MNNIKNTFSISGCRVFVDGVFKNADISLCNGRIFISEPKKIDDSDCGNKNPLYVFPGFTDVHVHLREPGFSYKETVCSGTAAAAKGGYTRVCAMPNVNPAPDCGENLAEQLRIIERDACIRVVPYGTITKERRGEKLSDMDSMADKVAGFSDDGSGVQDSDLMRAAMLRAKSLGKIIAAHCEDITLIKNGGCIHDGKYARKFGIPGISSQSEWKQIERDIGLVRETGCSYHVCHVSAKESVELLRLARAEGLDVTCETAPHYLVMTENDLEDDGRYKMNPPLRTEADREALISGIIDGTIGMIATDHAPHSAEEKSKGLRGSAMGIVGLETSFPVLYTELVKKGIITLEKLTELMSIAPANRFSFNTGIVNGEEGNFCVWDLNKKYKINPDRFYSMGKATPFAGKEVYGECKLTVCGGKAVYCADDFAV